MSKTLNAHNFLNIYRKILILDFKNIALIQGIQLPLNQFSQLLRMMKIEIFLNLILYIFFKNENIIPTNMCYDKVNVFTQKLQEIGITISNKMWKSLNPHNFLIIYCNIVMLASKWSSNWRRIFEIPLNQFSQLLMKTYMFLTLILYRTFQNENILPTNMFYDQMDVFIQNL